MNQAYNHPRNARSQVAPEGAHVAATRHNATVLLATLLTVTLVGSAVWKVTLDTTVEQHGTIDDPERTLANHASNSPSAPSQRGRRSPTRRNTLPAIAVEGDRMAFHDTLAQRLPGDRTVAQTLASWDQGQLDRMQQRYPGKAGRYAVHVISYPSPDSAIETADYLKHKGYSVYVEGIRLEVQDRHPDKLPVWRVRIGPFSRFYEAEKYRRNLESREHIYAHVVKGVPDSQQADDPRANAPEAHPRQVRAQRIHAQQVHAQQIHASNDVGSPGPGSSP